MSAERPLFTATWPQIAAICGTVALTLGTSLIGGIYYLGEKLYSGLDSSLSQLQTDTTMRFGGAGDEDRHIRRSIEENATRLAGELSKQGDRIVETTAQIGREVGDLRKELVAAMQESEQRVNARFDRLDGNMDKLLGRISFQPSQPFEVHPDTIYRIDETGRFIDAASGRPLGNVRVLTPDAWLRVLEPDAARTRDLTLPSGANPTAPAVGAGATTPAMPAVKPEP